MASIFLSHSNPDKPFARKLASSLRNAGHVVWIDEAEIKIGDSLVSKIRDGLDRVDYVAALLSDSSINSPWVEKELDIASNREIDENRVIVLPLLLSDVDLPGFLKGKLYGDFRKEKNYESTLDKLLSDLGPTDKIDYMSSEETEILKSQLAEAKKLIQAHTKDRERHVKLASLKWSDELRNSVDKANKTFPSHKIINEAYAFDVGNTSVTLDYLLWGISKARRKGMHILDILLTVEDKWPEAQAMIEAYSDLVGSHK